MKLPETLRLQRVFSKDKKGVALITVLTVMALTTILVLTFFSLATSEQRASHTYSQGLHAHQVAEQAVNLVIAQIREGTNTETRGTALDARKVWACQPGAIRRWTNNGDMDAVFKLYSDDAMVEQNPTGLAQDYDNLKGWSTKPSHFVDLNEPVIRGEKVYYPIVHPAAANYPKWPASSKYGRGEGVEGFFYNTDVIEEGDLGQKAARIADAAEGHLAMPAMWLYQLADGTIGHLNESGTDSTGYKFQAISGTGTPSEDNQMVARFAFWTDDETQKLNINTHAGGLAWDIPKAGGEMDMAMGRYQPAQKEWQRYPGHPATTHLGAALSPGIVNIVNDRDAMEMLYEVVPRVVGGGSESGTRLIDTRNPDEQNGLVPDTDPLFPSIDDMVMRSDREPHEYPGENGQPVSDAELSEYLERSKFFITAHSRAPEVNIFNLPKVAMWPIYNAPRSDDSQSDYQTKLTPFDRLIHYCASVGGDDSRNRFDYIFRREQADSTTHDYENIDRNKVIYDYLDQMMSNNVPGYGGSFSSKYTRDGQRQLLTQIFDYIRSTNLHDDSLYEEDFAAAYTKQNKSEHPTFTNPRDGREFNKGFGHKGHGQVTPIRIDDTKGMGRFYTLANAGVLVACIAQTQPIGSAFPGVRDYRGQGVLPPSGTGYPNIPPLPQGQDTPNTYPQWVKDLEMTNPEEYAAFEDPANWNWNLAFLDSAYLSAVISNPSANKFSQQALGADTANGNTRLQAGQKLMQAAFVFDLFSPNIGWNGLNPDMQIDITAQSGMTFTASASNPGGSTIPFLGFTPSVDRPAGVGSETYRWATNWTKPHREGGARAWGGLLPFTWLVSARDVLADRAYKNRASVWWQMGTDRQTINRGIRSRLTPLDKGYDQITSAVSKVSNMREIGGSPADIAQSYRYDLITMPFLVESGGDVSFDGGEVLFEISDGGDSSESSFQDDDETSLVQTIELEFPPFRVAADKSRMSGGGRGRVNEFNDLSWDSAGFLAYAGVTADPANHYKSKSFNASLRGGPWNGGGAGDDRVPNASTGRLSRAVNTWQGAYVSGGDIVRTLSVGHGDIRLMAADPEVEIGEYFKPHRYYEDSNRAMAHSLTNAIGQPRPGFSLRDEDPYLIVPGLPRGTPYGNRAPMPFATELSRDVQRYGDFDNGAGTMIDGPYINKPDEGNVHALRTRFTQEIVDYWEQRRDYGEFPYFSNPEKAEAGGPAYFSPNRIVSGPGMFGSLPTGLGQDKPWQTLLFRPNVVGDRYSSHPGAEDPPDHLIMDLFWMPVVEPYAISEPLSTAGKVNLNYEMAPFFHVERTTALRGVFKSEYMVCIPNEYHNDYKHGRGRGSGYHWRDNPFGGELQGKNLRTAIEADKTFEQFEEKFENGNDLFKSSSEICEVHLVPIEVSDLMDTPRGSIGHETPDSYRDMANGSYWKEYLLVGDNSRERPYTNIQTRLTTKSNTFQVHYRAQVIKQSRRTSGGSQYDVWLPELDTVQAEYRGSSIIERFVDPNDTELPDFAEDPTESLMEFYQFRVVNPRRFAP